MGISEKQESFARLVAQGKTYSEAYREAYPSSRKWKNESVWVKSSQLMANDKVRIRVNEIQEELIADQKITLEQILNELKNWVLFDPLEMFNPDDSVKSIHEMPEEVRKCIASFEVVELFENIDKEKIKTGELKRVKLIDKKAVSDQIMKHLGAYVNTKLELGDDTLDALEDIFGGLEK